MQNSKRTSVFWVAGLQKTEVSLPGSQTSVFYQPGFCPNLGLNNRSVSGMG